MDILVLGGTAFVGRAIVNDLLARGHSPTLFTRGVTNSDLFPELPHKTGDRSTGDYTSLAGATWDAVVDVSAYVPRHVNEAMAAIDAHRYLFISTVSVYDISKIPEGGAIDEQSPRLPVVRDTEEVTPATYGGLKVACEDDLAGWLGDRLSIVRPGIVAGPHDHTDRFTSWVRRVARGGRLALPGRLDQPVQVVDSRDLARLVTTLLEDDRPGTYNATGESMPMSTFVSTMATGLGTSVELVPVDVSLGGDRFPLIIEEPSKEAMFRASAAAAHAVGMPQTPLADTARFTHEWDVARGLPPLVVGWSQEQEGEILGA